MNELDRHLLLLLRNPADLADPIGPQWLQRAAVDVTALGSHAVLVLLVLAVAGLLVVERRRLDALWLVLATSGVMLLSHGLKTAFGRARPEVVDHLVVVVSPSFPSGHALLSAAVYLMLAALPEQGVTPRMRHGLFGVAVLLTLLIGISRVYLGVHWPTDVLGGWIIGSLWFWICQKARSRLRHRQR